VTGRFQQVDSDYQASLDLLDKQETEQKTYIQSKTSQLQTQFAVMEQTLSKLQAASGAIGALAANLLSSSSSSGSKSNSNSNSGGPGQRWTKGALTTLCRS